MGGVLNKVVGTKLAYPNAEHNIDERYVFDTSFIVSLEGSEKQINWAEKIRSSFIDGIRDTAENTDIWYDGEGKEYDRTPEPRSYYGLKAEKNKLVEATVMFYATQLNKASDWIKVRDYVDTKDYPSFVRLRDGAIKNFPDQYIEYINKYTGKNYSINK